MGYNLTLYVVREYFLNMLVMLQNALDLVALDSVGLDPMLCNGNTSPLFPQYDVSQLGDPFVISEFGLYLF